MRHLLARVQSLGDCVESGPSFTENSVVGVGEEEDERADQLWNILAVVHLGLVAEGVQKSDSSSSGHRIL